MSDSSPTTAAVRRRRVDRVVGALRGPARPVALWLLVVAIVLALTPLPPQLTAAVAAPGAALLLASVFAPMLRGTPGDGVAPIAVDPPVGGTWSPLETPALRVPSTGSHDDAGTFALVVAADPLDRRRPRFNNPESGLLPPERFPGFGEPVLAMAPGVVVRAADDRADHRSRSRLGAVLFSLTIEAFLRALGGEGARLGNRVVVRLDDGSHLLYAHLRHGSVQVAPGDAVAAGDVLAGCGCSGAAAEPQLRVQRQDIASPSRAAGLPWAIRGAGAKGADGFPPSGTAWAVPRRDVASGSRPAD